MAPPVRTCLGCGTARPQAELVRVARSGEKVLADPARRLPGRGGYLCGPQCLEAAAKRKSFGRAFRQKVELDLPGLGAALRDALKDRGVPLTPAEGKN